MKKAIFVIIMTLLVLCSCSSETDEGVQKESVVTTSSVTSTETLPGNSSEYVHEMPDQSFIGVWSTDESKTNQILIYEITEDSMKFNSGVCSLFGFDATAVIRDGKIVFGDGISPEYSGPNGVKGRLEFSGGSITVTYEDFGSVEHTELYPMEYTFTLKDENSDDIISQYKATLQ